jgi:alpha-beta hydrolase superfamily lysophospholipase
MSDSYLLPLTASDGDNIAVQDWPFTDNGLNDDTPQGTVLIVHGLGEHAARYAQVADDLNGWGYTVRSYDQVGHGDSDGQRGALPHDDRLIDDLADVVDSVRRLMRPKEPLILLGHSMGGVVAAQFVLRKIRPVDGLILSSPAFDLGLNAVQKLLVSTLPHIIPNLRVGNGLKQKYISRDPQVVRDYQNDPLVHDRISARLAQWIAVQGAACIAAAAQWSTPTLLVYAGADQLVSPAGSRAFAKAAPPKLVQSYCFDEMYHEILNDPERAQVLAVIKRWLAATAHAGRFNAIFKKKRAVA